MKAVVVEKAGGPEVLQVRERPIPQVKPGWSLVKVQGFGINHSEIFTRQGHSPSVSFPRVLGIECVGIVVDSTSDQVEEGQQIISIMGEMGRAFDGGYAEYVLLPNEQLYPIESSLPLESLIALPETYYTAFGSYKTLQINDRDRVLVRGATSGVGLAFARLIKGQFPNIYLAGSSRSLDKEAQLLAAGFDQVILDQDNVLQTEEAFTKIYDLIGPKAMADTVKHLREFGILSSNGLLGGQWTLEDFDHITGFNNKYFTSFYSGDVSGEKFQELVDFVKVFDIDVSPEKVFRLDDIQEAHTYLESKQSFGKVIVLNEEVKK